MPLTADERKRKLGHGGLSKIARRKRLTPSHVAQVNKQLRRDDDVEAAITNDIIKRHPEIDPADVWDEWPAALAS